MPKPAFLGDRHERPACIITLVRPDPRPGVVSRAHVPSPAEVLECGYVFALTIRPSASDGSDLSASARDLLVCSCDSIWEAVYGAGVRRECARAIVDLSLMSNGGAQPQSA
jgi:hypothetical protein